MTGITEGDESPTSQQLFGKLVQALRTSRADRRTQAELAAEIAEMHQLPEGEWTKNTIINIEHGKIQRFSASRLAQLADGLNLTTRERREFYAAGLGLNALDIVRQKKSSEAIFQEHCGYIKAMELPAMIVDPYLNIRAANHSMMHFYDFTEKQLRHLQRENPLIANLMMMVFSDKTKDFFRESIFTGKWNIIAQSQIQLFCATSLRYRTTDTFKQLFAALWKNRDFKRIWHEARDYEQDDYSDLEAIDYYHPVLDCQIKYSVSLTTALTPDGELYMLIYVPMNPATAAAFAGLANEHRNKIIEF